MYICRYIYSTHTYRHIQYVYILHTHTSVCVCVHYTSYMHPQPYQTETHAHPYSLQPSKVYASNSGCHWTQSGWGLLQRQRAGEARDGHPHMIRRHAAGLPSSHAVPETMKTSPPADTYAVRIHPYSYNLVPPSNTHTKSSTCNMVCDICPIPLWD